MSSTVGNNVDRYCGEVALITGASSGIGRAIAENLAGAGMRLALVARSLERLDAVAGELKNKGAVVITAATDLCDEDAILSMFETVREKLGGVRVLVNSAGVGYRAPLLSGDTAQWRQMLELNVLGLCVCTREAVADMRASGDFGHVVHISSMAAHRVAPGGGLYGATKYAVRALTESVRHELHALGSAIRVSAVSPGIVQTAFGPGFYGSEDEAAKAYENLEPLRPQDVADAVGFALGQPQHVQVHDILVRPTQQRV